MCRKLPLLLPVCLCVLHSCLSLFPQTIAQTGFARNICSLDSSRQSLRVQSLQSSPANSLSPLTPTLLSSLPTQTFQQRDPAFLSVPLSSSAARVARSSEHLYLLSFPASLSILKRSLSPRMKQNLDLVFQWRNKQVHKHAVAGRRKQNYNEERLFFLLCSNLNDVLLPSSPENPDSHCARQKMRNKLQALRHQKRLRGNGCRMWSTRKRVMLTTR